MRRYQPDNKNGLAPAPSSTRGNGGAASHPRGARSIIARLMRPFATAFPAGAGGAGLVLLRMSVLLGFYEMHGVGAPDWTGLLWGATSLLLAAGLLTPVAVAACVAWNLVCFYASARPDLAWIVGSALAATALGLLGPGAYSLDARLFGRRRLLAGDTD